MRTRLNTVSLVALAAALIGLGGCLENSASTASKPKTAAANRVGQTYALAAQPDWRTIETAAGQNGAGQNGAGANAAQVAQAAPPSRAPVKTIITTEPPATPAAEAQPGRATTIMNNARSTQQPRSRILPPAAVLTLTTPTAPAAPVEPIPAAELPAQAPDPIPAPATVVEKTEPAPTPAPKPTLAQVADRRAWRVQIAAVTNETAAEGVWSKASAAHTDLLGALDHTIERAEIDGKGTYFRVQTKAFSDRKEAETLCSDLKARNLTCIVVRTAG